MDAICNDYFLCVLLLRVRICMLLVARSWFDIKERSFGALVFKTRLLRVFYRKLNALTAARVPSVCSRYSQDFFIAPFYFKYESKMFSSIEINLILIGLCIIIARIGPAFQAEGGYSFFQISIFKNQVKHLFPILKSY